MGAITSVYHKLSTKRFAGSKHSGHLPLPTLQKNVGVVLQPLVSLRAARIVINVRLADIFPIDLDKQLLDPHHQSKSRTQLGTMPLTERLRRELDRMEAANERRLFMNGSEPHGNFRGLTNEEFTDVTTHRFWAEVREFHLTDAPDVTRLPPLPSALQLLSLRNTGIKTLPRLPATLTELQLAENRALTIPNEIPRHIEIIVLDRNGLRELPLISPRTSFTIHEPELVEPFRGLLNAYTQAKRAFRRVRPTTVNARLELLDAQRAFFRGLEQFWSARKANIRSRARGPATLKRLEKVPFSGKPGNSRPRLPESALGEIGKYLTGEPAHYSPDESLAALREKHETLPRGARGGTRRRFRTRRASTAKKT